MKNNISEDYNLIFHFNKVLNMHFTTDLFLIKSKNQKAIIIEIKEQFLNKLT